MEYFSAKKLRTEITATLLTLTLSGSNHSLCCNFFGSAKLNVVDTLIFGPSGKTTFSDPAALYVSSFIYHFQSRHSLLLCCSTDQCYSTNYISYIFSSGSQSHLTIILVYNIFVAHDTTSHIKTRLVDTYGPI